MAPYDKSQTSHSVKVFEVYWSQWNSAIAKNERNKIDTVKYNEYLLNDQKFIFLSLKTYYILEVKWLIKNIYWNNNH